MSVHAFAQSFDSEKVSLGNFIRRMYTSQSFSGVKILQTEEGVKYMISVVEQKKDQSKSDAILNRIASVKAKSYASQYVNGSNVTTEVIVLSTHEKKGDIVVGNSTIQEIFKESSSGFIEGLELLLTFLANDEKVVHVFYKSLK